MRLQLISLSPLLSGFSLTSALSITLSVPAHIPSLPSSTTAYLTTFNHTLSAPVTKSNRFVFRDVTTWPIDSKDTTTATSYLLDIECRDYDFASYGVDVKATTEGQFAAELYRVVRGGIEVGREANRVKIGDDKVGPAVSAVELKLLRTRDYYEARSGFNPMDLLKNPMVLIGIVGLGFVIGVPYLLENMDPETRKEFEEQQRKGIFGGAGGGSGSSAGTGGRSGESGSTANSLQNFELAAWMAGRQQPQQQNSGSTSGSATGGGGGGGGGEGVSRSRRRG